MYISEGPLRVFAPESPSAVLSVWPPPGECCLRSSEHALSFLTSFKVTEMLCSEMSFTLSIFIIYILM